MLPVSVAVRFGRLAVLPSASKILRTPGPGSLAAPDPGGTTLSYSRNNRRPCRAGLRVCIHLCKRKVRPVERGHGVQRVTCQCGLDLSDRLGGMIAIDPLQPGELRGGHRIVAGQTADTGDSPLLLPEPPLPRAGPGSQPETRDRLPRALPTPGSPPARDADGGRDCPRLRGLAPRERQVPELSPPRAARRQDRRGARRGVSSLLDVALAHLREYDLVEVQVDVRTADPEQPQTEALGLHEPPFYVTEPARDCSAHSRCQAPA